MAAKLVVIIVSVGIVSILHLHNRQIRLELAHESLQLHERRAAQEQAMWTLHCRLAERMRPDVIRQLLDEQHSEWRQIAAPVQATWCAEPLIAEDLAASQEHTYGG